MVMFQSLANRIARLRLAMGRVQCLLSLSHRAWGNDALRACTSSLLYGVSRTSLLPCSFSCFICFY